MRTPLAHAGNVACSKNQAIRLKVDWSTFLDKIKLAIESWYVVNDIRSVLVIVSFARIEEPLYIWFALVNLGDKTIIEV